MGQTGLMVQTWESLGRSVAGRRARGVSRRLRDAGVLLASGRVPERRAHHSRALAQEPESLGAPPYFCGWTRYSAFRSGSKAFVASRQSTDDEAYKSDLWSPERLGPREQIFLGLSLPLLQRMAAQHAYAHFVTYSEDMPEPWQENLHEAVRTHSVLQLHPVHRALRYVIREHLIAEDSPSRTVVQFRVDDDDLLALSYLDALSGYATPHDEGRAISLARGYTAVWHDGRVSQLRGVHRRLGSQGQAYVGSWDAATQTLDLPTPGSHASVDRRMPTILDSRQPAFLHLRHRGQDTASPDKDVNHLKTTGPKTTPLGHEELRAALDAFPTLRAVLDADESETADTQEAPHQGQE